jgi:hypothetical protein
MAFKTENLVLKNYTNSLTGSKFSEFGYYGTHDTMAIIKGANYFNYSTIDTRYALEKGDKITILSSDGVELAIVSNVVVANTTATVTLVYCVNV